MEMEELQDSIFSQVRLLKVDQLELLCNELQLQIAPSKKGKKFPVSYVIR